jgi:hypothetical protein
VESPEKCHRTADSVGFVRASDTISAASFWGSSWGVPSASMLNTSRARRVTPRRTYEMRRIGWADGLLGRCVTTHLRGDVMAGSAAGNQNLLANICATPLGVRVVGAGAGGGEDSIHGPVGYLDHVEGSKQMTAWAGPGGWCRGR